MSYGSDTSCLSSLVTGRIARGPRLVVEAIVRRLNTPRGMLGGGDDESIYGLDVAGYLGSTDPEFAAASLPGMIENEILKDDRVLSVQVQATLADDGGAAYSLTLEITGTLSDEEETFAFTAGVDDVGLDLIGGIL